MGAQSFIVEIWARSEHQAFRKAREDAHWEHGQGGYTGSIAEKNRFQMVWTSPEEEPVDLAEKLLEDDDSEFSKWGPAGCIMTPHKRVIDSGRTEYKYLFFGWASC
jgi:hypothetical protein